MAESLALARYWSELNPHNRSQGRSREALWASVVAHPDWMTLRDTQGCSPIMRALRLHPFLIRSLTPRRVPHSFLERDRDAAGRPLAFHLFLGLTNTENRSQTGKNPKEPYEWLLRLPCLDTRGRGLLDQWEQDKDEGTMLAGGSLWRPEGMAPLAKANELGPPSNWLSARTEDMDAWLDVFAGCPENIPYNQLPIPAFLFLESPVSWNREALANWSSHPHLIARVGCVLSAHARFSPDNGATVWVDAWLAQPQAQWPSDLVARATTLKDASASTPALKERLEQSFVAADLENRMTAASHPRARYRL